MKTKLHVIPVVLLIICLALASCATQGTSGTDTGQSGSVIESSGETDSDATLWLTDEDLALPAEPALTETIKAGIVEALTTTHGLSITEPRWADVDLDTVTIGLPIAYYFIDKSETGEYAFSSGEVYQLYPLYIDGRLDCLVQHSEMIPLDSIFDYDAGEMPNDHFKALFERLKEGTAGTVAVVLAKDGAYLFDGSSFELVSEDGAAEFGGVADEELEPQDIWHPASIADADLPDELTSEIRLTDTSVTEPIL